jgi:hypothetical protein
LWPRRLQGHPEPYELQLRITPFTLHPSTCVTHLTPVTPHPTPDSLHPAPCTLQMPMAYHARILHASRCRANVTHIQGSQGQILALVLKQTSYSVFNRSHFAWKRCHDFGMSTSLSQRGNQVYYTCMYTYTHALSKHTTCLSRSKMSYHFRAACRIAAPPDAPLLSEVGTQVGTHGTVKTRIWSCL